MKIPHVTDMSLYTTAAPKRKTTAHMNVNKLQRD